MTIGRPLFAKLFLEGIEVPFIGASITHTVNQAAIAYIDVVPHASINKIKPRTLVHLMVRNVNDSTGKYPFVLAFQGEVFGFNFGKTSTSRSFSISCIDQSSYWDNVLTYFFNPQQSLGAGTDTIYNIYNDEQTLKAAEGKKEVTHSEEAYLKRIITKAYADAKAKGKVPDLFEGLVAIFKDIGDVNEFYKAAEDRLRINDRICSASSGSVTKLLAENESLDWLMGVASRQSGFNTLRSVVTDLMGIIFHDFTPIPFPAVVENSGVSQSLTKSKVPTTIGEFVFKPNLYMVAPPLCNVFFPDEYASFNYSRNFFQEPTRLVYKPEIPSFVGAGVKGITLPQVYEPPIVSYFMFGNSGIAVPTDAVGPGDDQVSTLKDVGFYGDKDVYPDGPKKGQIRDSTNGKKKQQSLLTNIEKYKGIILAQESMVPAASQFKQFIADLNKATFVKGVAKYLFYKKKFQTRQVQITSHLKMSVVPGFTALILDDSDAEQTITAYCSSVTHRIYCNQGGYTNTTLSYARQVREQDAASDKASEPIIPPWMSEEIFGKKASPKAAKNAKEAVGVAKQATAISEINKAIKGTLDKFQPVGALPLAEDAEDAAITAEEEAAGDQNIVPDALSKYFASLLGPRGSATVNQHTGRQTLLGASQKLLAEYKANRKHGGDAVPNMIDRLTSRKYVTMNEAFHYFGAEPVGGSSEGSSFNEYYGKRLMGGLDTMDHKQLVARRDVIKRYRDALRSSRGFRG